MAFLLFSGKTAPTGSELAATLKIGCGRQLPTKPHDLIINWGAGAFKPPITTKRIINHPKFIRNKLSMLQHLENNKIPIPTFVPASQVKQAIKDGTLSFPIIGRTSSHQAGSGFWLCLDMQVVDAALSGGANYFQKWESIATEYRVHVFGGEAIGTYKKTLRSNPKEEFCIGMAKEIAEENTKFNVNDIAEILKKAVKHITNPDFNIRSLHRGWKFVKSNNPPQTVLKVAIDSVKASGLDFGAVDMMYLGNNTAKFIELNTGPGMDIGGGAFDAYVNKLKQVVNSPVLSTTAPAKTTHRVISSNGGRIRKPRTWRL